MERVSRFLWELHCGPKDQHLFEQALTVLAEVIEQTGSLSLLTDGERRYGNLLFEICHERSSAPVVAVAPKNDWPKGCGCGLRTKGPRSVPVANVRSIKRRCPSIPKPSMRLQNRRFIPVMWRPLIPQCDVVIRPFGAKPTLMPNRKLTCKEHLMCTGWCTILCGCISPPRSCQL